MTYEELTIEKANRYDDLCKLISVRTARIHEIEELDRRIGQLMLFDTNKVNVGAALDSGGKTQEGQV